jgi:hypothetical protein
MLYIKMKKTMYFCSKCIVFLMKFKRDNSLDTFLKVFSMFTLQNVEDLQLFSGQLSVMSVEPQNPNALRICVLWLKAHC